MKFVKDNLAPITALATALSALIAIVLGVEEKIVYSIILLAVFVLVPLAAALRSRWDRDREQSQFFTLVTDNLQPNKTKKYLGLKANIAVVGDQTCEGMFESLRAHLQEVDSDLQISQFIFAEGMDIDLQRGDLWDVLSGADSVILARTTVLEKEDWIYKAVDQWAYQNSNVPIVVIDKLARTPIPMELKKITERFYFIPDHQSSLSWRLLKRANGRSLSWRNQATFNRSVSLAVVILVLTLLGAAFLIDYLQKREMYDLMRTTYKQVAEHTKEDYQTFLQKLIENQGTPEAQRLLFQKLKDDKQLNLSYWLTYNGTFYPLATTDPRSSYTPWRQNDMSIVGCVLRKPNRLVVWDDKMSRPEVTAHNGDKLGEDPYCGYGGQVRRKIHSIACSSYSAIPEDANYTVGVCVFTETETDDANVTKGPANFLVKPSREFYETVSPLIKEGKFIPH